LPRALLTASASPKVRALLVPASTLATDKKYSELEVEKEKSRDETGRKFDCVEGAVGN